MTSDQWTTFLGSIPPESRIAAEQRLGDIRNGFAMRNGEHLFAAAQSHVRHEVAVETFELMGFAPSTVAWWFQTL